MATMSPEIVDPLLLMSPAGSRVQTSANPKKPEAWRRIRRAAAGRMR